MSSPFLCHRTPRPLCLWQVSSSPRYTSWSLVSTTAVGERTERPTSGLGVLGQIVKEVDQDGNVPCKFYRLLEEVYVVTRETGRLGLPDGSHLPIYRVSEGICTESHV